ncbi:MAG: hypothetical protein KAS91_01820, partial [Candidatus Pacebacteria bacterium]|nr:hypothetical protein [Candidatus Paceibacterota bacterium]
MQGIKKCRRSLKQASQNDSTSIVANKNNLSSPYPHTPLKNPRNTGIISLHHGRLRALTVA